MLDLGSPPNSVIESMELVRLPSPPQVLSKLLDICHDPDSSVEDLAELIGTDAALTSNLLMAINSPAFAIHQPVDDLEHAITLLGHGLVKTLVVTSSIQQLFAGLVNTRKEFVCNAWLDSLYCAEFARHFAESLDYAHPGDAYLAGLLHDFGQIVLDSKFHEQYAEIIASTSELEMQSKEIAMFGISHTELSAAIIEQWPSLSPAIADAARFHHESEEQLQGCDILCQIVAEASQVALHWSRSGKADTKWESKLVDEAELKVIYSGVRDSIAEVTDRLGISQARSGSLTQAQLVRDIEKETLRLARRIRDASLIKIINPADGDAHPAESPRDLLLRIAREMQLLFSIEDIALLFPDSEDAEYLTLHEVKHPQPLSKFTVENNRSLIVRSYLDRKSYWIEPDNKLDTTPQIADRQIVRRLNHELVFSMPFGHGENVIGTILIGANKAQKRPLDNLAKFISGYLKNVADHWLRHSRVTQQQFSADVMKKEQEQKDIEKLVHEIGNPLSVIGNYIDIIKGNSTDGGANDREIAILKEELQRISHIVATFKDAKTSTSQAVELNEELKMCVPLYVNSISRGRDVQIHWHLDEIEAEVEITRDELRQVVLNLVKNAVEATRDNPEIIVSSHHFVNIDGKAYAQFSIADRGRGVDAKTRKLLFAATTSTKRGANRGHGLSVVADILGGFDGHIKYMENEGGGATFEVLLPLLLEIQPDD